MMIRKITPNVTWVPWKPVIMKKLEPNWSAPHGLPQGRTPSMISLVHSKPCIPTNVAPNAAVTSINAALLTRSWREPKLRLVYLLPLRPLNGKRAYGNEDDADVRHAHG